jgi:tetratricopeptide (TPR) repeat protein
MRVSILTVLFSFSALSLAVPQAAAQAPEPTTNAEQHSKRGVELYAEGKLPEAVAEMLKAYELAPAPGLLYNIARIYQKMGQRDLAITYLKRFVTQPGADPDRVQKALKHLEELNRTPFNPPRLEAPPAESEPAAKPQVAESPTPQGATPSSTVVAATDSGRDDTLAWVTLASGGAALIAGGVLGGLALSSAADLSDPALDYDAKADAQAASRGLALGADISIGVGIAAATLGLVLLLTGGDDAPAQATVTPTLGPEQAGVQLMVRFP